MACGQDLVLEKEMAPQLEACGLRAGSSREEPPHHPLELEFEV